MELEEQIFDKVAFSSDSSRFYYVDYKNYLKVIDLEKKMNIGVFALKTANRKQRL